MSMVSDDTNFLLRHENRSEAYEALRVLCDEKRREEILPGLLVRFELITHLTEEAYVRVEREVRQHLLTIAHAVEKNAGLFGVLDDLGWENFCSRRNDLPQDEFGVSAYDLKNICCDKKEETLLDDFLFEVLAPYVEKDSYIQCFNDEGESWRFVFDGMHCQQMQPQTTWVKRRKRT